MPVKLTESNGTVTKRGRRPSVKKEVIQTHSAEEIRSYAQKIKDTLQLINPSKSETRTYTTFSRETLRTYLKNPASYYLKLVELSRYLYTRSNPYRKIIWYNASMINPDFRSIIPLINLTKTNDTQSSLKQFYNTARVLDSINLQSEILKMNLIAWREDTAYGCIYYDDTGLFILPLPYNYCKVTGMYTDGTLSFSMDMSYFTNRQEQLQFYGDPFVSMYSAYQKDQTMKYQSMPDENCFCIKVNIDDPTMPMPPYTALFNSIINLCDTEDLQATKDEASVYKTLVFSLDTRTDATDADDFTVDPDTAIAYFNRAVEALPEYVNAILSPVDVNAIAFKDDQASDINIIENATKTLYNSSGGAQVLNSSTISGGTAWNGAIVSDILYATSIIRPQIESWLNRWIAYNVAKPARIKLLAVTPYDKATYKADLQKDAMYGIPVKLTLNTLNGYTELETLSLNFLEENCLNLSSEFIPLQSSNTQSGTSTSGGAPTIDTTKLTDEGAKTRDQNKNNN